MPKNTSNTSSDILKSLFHRSEKGFFRITELRGLLTADERAQLKITKSSSQKKVLEGLGDLASPYELLKKSKSSFITNKSVQDTLLEHIAQNPGKTISETTKSFPLNQKKVIEEANKLIEQKMVSVHIQPDQKIVKNLAPKIELFFQLNGQQQSPQVESVASDTTGPAKNTGGDDPVQTFKAAYDHEGRGSDFVELFKIRRNMGLPREDFDNLLKDLSSEEYIMLNMGNPGNLTPEEIQDSFQDEFGDLYITVSWR